jgi:hypothetical protein
MAPRSSRPTRWNVFLLISIPILVSGAAWPGLGRDSTHGKISTNAYQNRLPGEILVGCVDCNRSGRLGDKALIMKLLESDVEALRHISLILETGAQGGFGMQRIMFAVVLSAITIVPAFADVRIRSSPGGVVSDYLKFFSQVRQSGERVIIDGPCLSACTLVLDVVPRNRICVTSRAILGFHAPQVVDYRTGRILRSRQATRAVIAAYPARVRAWINRHGGLTRKLIFLRGRQLAALYPHC